MFESYASIQPNVSFAELLIYLLCGESTMNTNHSCSQKLRESISSQRSKVETLENWVWKERK